MGFCLLPSFVASQPLREGRLLRILPQRRLRALNIYAIYPSRRFLDAKTRTWVEFLKAELPPLLQGDEAILDDPQHWATAVTSQVALSAATEVACDLLNFAIGPESSP